MVLYFFCLYFYFFSSLFEETVRFTITSFSSESDHEDCREHWNQPDSRNQLKHQNQQASLLPTKLPARAHLPSCAGIHIFAQNGCLVIFLHIMFLMAMAMAIFLEPHKNIYIFMWLLTLIFFKGLPLLIA